MNLLIIESQSHNLSDNFASVFLFFWCCFSVDGFHLLVGCYFCSEILYLQHCLHTNTVVVNQFLPLYQCEFLHSFPLVSVFKRKTLAPLASNSLCKPDLRIWKDLTKTTDATITWNGTSIFLLDGYKPYHLQDGVKQLWQGTCPLISYWMEGLHDQSTYMYIYI